MLAFLLIVGVSFYVMANSMTGLVGDYLFEQRKRADSISVEELAVQFAPLFEENQTEALYSQMHEAGGQLEGRLLIIDKIGKVQFDTFSQLNGTKLDYPEVLSVLSNQKTVDYGVHKLQDENQSRSFFSFLQPYSTSDNWVAYSTAPLIAQSGTIGVLLYAAPIQDMLAGLYSLQNQMIYYFILVAIIALVVALIFSQVITKPIAALTKGIQRMGKGDLTARVPVRGSGEMRRMAETFNAMSEKLEALDQSRNQFVSNASHELKTPLATMKIMLESIIYQPEMPEALRTEFMTDMNKEIDRLSLIIGDLLTLVQMDTQNMKLNRENIKLKDLVTENEGRLLPVITNKNIKLHTEFEDDGEMYADGPKLAQVIYNLMENAVKYSNKESEIYINIRREGRDIRLSVKDNGPGIPKEDQPHIFDRFYRVDKARSRDTGGTGLGLSIVKQIVMLHGGSVSVKSEENKGSEFIVLLPAHKG